MSRKLGERRQLARQVRKRLAAYLYWLEARAELGRLIGLRAAGSGIGGDDADGHLETTDDAVGAVQERRGQEHQAGG